MSAKRFLPIALLAALYFVPAPGQTDKQPPDVRVMSYNIRYGTAQDGENHWDKRKEFLVETIKSFDPDLLGTSESVRLTLPSLFCVTSGWIALCAR